MMLFQGIGHACGHNLIAGCAVASFLALIDEMKDLKAKFCSLEHLLKKAVAGRNLIRLESSKTSISQSQFMVQVTEQRSLQSQVQDDV